MDMPHFMVTGGVRYDLGGEIIVWRRGMEWSCFPVAKASFEAHEGGRVQTIHVAADSQSFVVSTGMRLTASDGSGVGVRGVFVFAVDQRMFRPGAGSHSSPLDPASGHETGGGVGAVPLARGVSAEVLPDRATTPLGQGSPTGSSTGGLGSGGTPGLNILVPVVAAIDTPQLGIVLTIAALPDDSIMFMGDDSGRVVATTRWLDAQLSAVTVASGRSVGISALRLAEACKVPGPPLKSGRVLLAVGCTDGSAHVVMYTAPQQSFQVLFSVEAHDDVVADCCLLAGHLVSSGVDDSFKVWTLTDGSGGGKYVPWGESMAARFGEPARPCDDDPLDFDLVATEAMMDAFLQASSMRVLHSRQCLLLANHCMHISSKGELILVGNRGTLLFGLWQEVIHEAMRAPLVRELSNAVDLDEHDLASSVLLASRRVSIEKVLNTAAAQSSRLAFAPDSSAAAAAIESGRARQRPIVRVWHFGATSASTETQPASQEETRPQLWVVNLRGHTAPILVVQFFWLSGQDKRLGLFTAAMDHTARIWDAVSSQPLVVVENGPSLMVPWTGRMLDNGNMGAMWSWEAVESESTSMGTSTSSGTSLPVPEGAADNGGELSSGSSRLSDSTSSADCDDQFSASEATLRLQPGLRGLHGPSLKRKLEARGRRGGHYGVRVFDARPPFTGGPRSTFVPLGQTVASSVVNLALISLVDEGGGGQEGEVHMARVGLVLNSGAVVLVRVGCGSLPGQPVASVEDQAMVPALEQTPPDQLVLADVTWLSPSLLAVTIDVVGTWVFEVVEEGGSEMLRLAWSTENVGRAVWLLQRGRQLAPVFLPVFSIKGVHVAEMGPMSAAGVGRMARGLRLPLPTHRPILDAVVSPDGLVATVALASSLRGAQHAIVNVYRRRPKRRVRTREPRIHRKARARVIVHSKHGRYAEYATGRRASAPPRRKSAKRWRRAPVPVIDLLSEHSGEETASFSISADETVGSSTSILSSKSGGDHNASSSSIGSSSGRGVIDKRAWKLRYSLVAPTCDPVAMRISPDGRQVVVLGHKGVSSVLEIAVPTGT